MLAVAAQGGAAHQLHVRPLTHVAHQCAAQLLPADDEVLFGLGGEVVAAGPQTVWQLPVPLAHDAHGMVDVRHRRPAVFAPGIQLKEEHNIGLLYSNA